MAPIENGVDLNTLVFSKLSHTSDVSSFRCSEYKDLEDFLKNDALDYQKENVARDVSRTLKRETCWFFSHWRWGAFPLNL